VCPLGITFSLYNNYLKNKTTLPITIMRIAISFFAIDWREIFSFTMCGKNFVPNVVIIKTATGWKLPTKNTIATGAKSKAKLVKRFPATDINSLTMFIRRIVWPPVLRMRRKDSRYFGINKKINKPDTPKPKYSRKMKPKNYFPRWHIWKWFRK